MGGAVLAAGEMAGRRTVVSTASSEEGDGPDDRDGAASAGSEGPTVMAGRRRVVSASLGIEGATEGRGAVTSASTPGGEAGGGAVGMVAGTGRVAKGSPVIRGEAAEGVGAAGIGGAAVGAGATISSPRVTGKTAEQILQRARTPAAGTLAGSTR